MKTPYLSNALALLVLFATAVFAQTPTHASDDSYVIFSAPGVNSFFLPVGDNDEAQGRLWANPSSPSGITGVSLQSLGTCGFGTNCWMFVGLNQPGYIGFDSFSYQ